jgi:hypothetical protein
MMAHELVHVSQRSSDNFIQCKRLQDYSVSSKEIIEPSAMDNITVDDIKKTDEYKSYMDKNSVWYKELHVTEDEAINACYGILHDMIVNKKSINWDLEAEHYIIEARAIARKMDIMKMRYHKAGFEAPWERGEKKGFGEHTHRGIGLLGFMKNVRLSGIKKALIYMLNDLDRGSDVQYYFNSEKEAKVFYDKYKNDNSLDIDLLQYTSGPIIGKRGLIKWLKLLFAKDRIKTVLTLDFWKQVPVRVKNLIMRKQGVKGGVWKSPKFKNAINEMNNLPEKFIRGGDCSEIAEHLYKSADRAGEIYRIRGPKSLSQIKVPGQGQVYYHDVYTFGEYVLDPVISKSPIKMGEYFKKIKKLNSEVIFDRIK